MATPAEIAVAKTEITQKTRAQIETETARKWCARACAAFQQYTAEGDMRWLVDAIDYAHEAVEHASATDNDSVLADVRASVNASRKAALGF
jgi:hypothetical protein